MVNHLKSAALAGMLLAAMAGITRNGRAQDHSSLSDGATCATISFHETNGLRTYELKSNAPLRDDRPPDHQITFTERPDHAVARTGNPMFDGLYAMAVNEALQNSVSEIKDGAYDHGTPIKLSAFQTGEFWTYVWTRDLSYSVFLALAQFDPRRAADSLMFKTSKVKSSVSGGYRNQIIQDTGSGGSYPVSSDRVVWALGADAVLKYLPENEWKKFLAQIYPILHDTIEQDRKLIFDPADGLYRGETSFLDWREQTYPGWTKDNVITIAMSKALSVNAADYFLLKTTADYARRLGDRDTARRYTKWATDLKKAINNKFFAPIGGLYSTYLLSDGLNEFQPFFRYDLLGESLTILTGIADQARADSVLTKYPVGIYGPPVVWPQERTVPIYHNQAIWPFVTAFWTKAAQQSGNSAAVDLGIHSLMQEAAFNLSNMENFDLVTGRPEVKDQPLNGPVINSRRQLWSVAGYLSMVQDVVFGLDTSFDGIRFHPFVTAALRNGTFAGSDQIVLQNFSYRGTVNQVTIHLPPQTLETNGVCLVLRIRLNGKTVGRDFVSSARLQPANAWDILLGAPRGSGGEPKAFGMEGDDGFVPLQPVWDDSQNGGITLGKGRLVLHLKQPDGIHSSFNIYRDGYRYNCTPTDQGAWTDPNSGDYAERVHVYVAATPDPAIGWESHLSPPRYYATDSQKLTIQARDLQNHGGNLVGGHHFENWGKSGDELIDPNMQVNTSGTYAIRAEFSNGSGPVNTGITCAVKKLEVLNADTKAVVVSGYFIMPQSGNWSRWDLSNPIVAKLQAGIKYSLRISEDEYCRNMSYMENNTRYTSFPGGGPDAYNYVNIASIQLLRRQK